MFKSNINVLWILLNEDSKEDVLVKSTNSSQLPIFIFCYLDIYVTLDSQCVHVSWTQILNLTPACIVSLQITSSKSCFSPYIWWNFKAFLLVCVTQKTNSYTTVNFFFLPTFNLHPPLEADRREYNLLRITEIAISQVTSVTEHICREQRNGPYR